MSSTVDKSCTVIVVGYQGERWLKTCLDSLASASQRRLHLVLVDNGGNGDLDLLPCEQFETTIVRTPCPLGFAEANNFGLVHTEWDSVAICFLNQDTVSRPGWLDACLDCMFEHENVGAVTPLLKTYNGSEWDTGFRGYAWESNQFAEDSQTDRFASFYEVSKVAAAAMVVRTDALEQVGPFDPIFGSYYEDDDLCRRIRQAGYRIGICGAGTVWHYNGSSTRTENQERRRMRQIVRNRAICRIRQTSGLRLGAVLREFVRFPRNLGRSLARTASSQPPLVQIGAHFDLFRMLGRLVSQQRDARAFRDYLAEIGWNRRLESAQRLESSASNDGAAR